MNETERILMLWQRRETESFENTPAESQSGRAYFRGRLAVWDYLRILAKAQNLTPDQIRAEIEGETRAAKTNRENAKTKTDGFGVSYWDGMLHALQIADYIAIVREDELKGQV